MMIGCCGRCGGPRRCPFRQRSRQGDSPCSAPTAIPYQEALGASRHDGRSERQEGLPSHPPKRTNGADRRSDHSGTTQQGAQQPPATENLRETNVELREENPKTSPENLINTFCGAP